MQKEFFSSEAATSDSYSGRKKEKIQRGRGWRRAVEEEEIVRNGGKLVEVEKAAAEVEDEPAEVGAAVEKAETPPEVKVEPAKVEAVAAAPAESDLMTDGPEVMVKRVKKADNQKGKETEPLAVEFLPDEEQDIWQAVADKVGSNQAKVAEGGEENKEAAVPADKAAVKVEAEPGFTLEEMKQLAPKLRDYLDNYFNPLPRLKISWEPEGQADLAKIISRAQEHWNRLEGLPIDKHPGLAADRLRDVQDFIEKATTALAGSQAAFETKVEEAQTAVKAAEINRVARESVDQAAGEWLAQTKTIKTTLDNFSAKILGYAPEDFERILLQQTGDEKMLAVFRQIYQAGDSLAGRREKLEEVRKATEDLAAILEKSGLTDTDRSAVLSLRQKLARLGLI